MSIGIEQCKLCKISHNKAYNLYCLKNCQILRVKIGNSESKLAIFFFKTLYILLWFKGIIPKSLATV